jgi:hypothetical protein
MELQPPACLHDIPLHAGDVKDSPALYDRADTPLLQVAHVPAEAKEHIEKVPTVPKGSSSQLVRAATPPQHSTIPSMQHPNSSSAMRSCCTAEHLGLHTWYSADMASIAA